MPQAPRSEAQLQDVKARIEAKLREGYRPKGMTGTGPGAIQAAAAEAVSDGLFSTAKAFLTAAYFLEGEHEPDWTLYRPKQYQHRPPGLPVIPSQDHVIDDDPEGEPIRAMVIGDAHDSPHLRDKSRFRWLGAYAADHGIELIVSVGDWWTMDCFSSHVDRASFEGLAKPTFDQDRDSFHESQRAFQDGLAGLKPKKLITLGNHEHRAWRYDNAHPDGSPHSLLVEEAFAQWGWRTSLYGEYRFIGGVGFIHVPLNTLGKPLAASQRPNKAMFDIVHGDDHRATVMTDHKASPFRSPTVYSAGTAFAPGYVEGFSNRSASTWRRGVCDAVLWGGHVMSWKFEDMLLLRKRYGRDGDGPKTVVSMNRAA